MRNRAELSGIESVKLTMSLEAELRDDREKC